MKYVACFLSAVLLFTLVPLQQLFADILLPEPTGKIILTVDGRITNKNLGERTVFDHAMLAKLDTFTIKTSTPWDVGISEFTGCRLSKLVAATEAQGTIMLVTALDGYEVAVPISDIEKYDPILAWAKNGNVMTIREKGPLWLIYPFDSNSELRGMEYSARSVWQIERIAFQ
jgi:hypothetical protein